MALTRRRRQNEERGGKNARDDPASLSTVSVLGKGSPRAGPQGTELALGRRSGLDATPDADAHDRWVSSDPDPSDRRGLLLRHAADSARHRRAQFLEQPLPGGPGRDGEGILLVDREELIHERSVSDDRQYGGQAASGTARRA